jgi:hypothetical protein
MTLAEKQSTTRTMQIDGFATEYLHCVVEICGDENRPPVRLIRQDGGPLPD